MIYGTDVSNYQPINFLLELPGTSVRPVDFAIIKITEGASYTNPKWTGQRQWARDHGLSTGFYHFARPGSMTAQADWFLSRIALRPGDHLWFDWEDAGVSSAQKDEWIKYVQAARPGHRVGLYCNTSFWKNRDTSGFAGDGLWIATGGYPAGSPPIEAPWLIHQFSTEGDYDHDLAQFGDLDDMLTWAYGEDQTVALTAEDKAWIRAEIRAAVKEVVYQTDGFLVAPPDAADYNPDPASPGHYWRGDTHTAETTRASRAAVKAAAEILAQARANGAALTDIKTTLAALDLSGLPGAVAAKLSALRLKLEEQA